MTFEKLIYTQYQIHLTFFTNGPLTMPVTEVHKAMNFFLSLKIAISMFISANFTAKKSSPLILLSWKDINLYFNEHETKP